MSFGYGIEAWLSHPTPGSRFSLNLNVKKTILAGLAFLLLVLLFVFELFFIEKFYLVFPPSIVHAILFLFELLAFLLFIHALFNERSKLMVPMCITQGIRVLLLAAVIVYYIVDVFQEENVPLEHRNSNRTKWTAKLVVHLIFAAMGHIFLFYIGYACMRLFSSPHRGSGVPKDSHAYGPGAHNIIILEQPIEQAMYGKKP